MELHWHCDNDGQEALDGFGSIMSMEHFWIARARNRVIGVFHTAADAKAAVTCAAIDDGYLIA